MNWKLQMPKVLKIFNFSSLQTLTHLSSLLLLVFTATGTAQIAVKGETVYTMAGEALHDGVVLVKDGKIERVGPVDQVPIPANYRVLSGVVVTPGFIDAHATVGLTGIYNQSQDRDELDKTSAIQPELRALDAYNARDPLVDWLCHYGVTTVHTGHAPGALASGQSIIVKTTGETVEAALVKSNAMITMTLGASVSSNYKKPGTRAKGMAMLRSQFLKTQAYMKKQAKKDKGDDDTASRDLTMEALAMALKGELPVLITANRATEIMSALRLAREFGLNMVLDGAAEAYLLLDEIKAAGVPVIIHPSMVRNYGDWRNASYETATKLRGAGIIFAFQSGYESYVPKTRVVSFAAAIAAANGLTFTETLRALTIDAATILGIDKRVGSLVKGKDADIAVFDGDPFEYLSRVCAVMIDGEVVHETCQ